MMTYHTFIFFYVRMELHKKIINLVRQKIKQIHQVPNSKSQDLTESAGTI